MSRLDSAIKEISAMRLRSDSDILVTDGIAGGATQITGFRRVSVRAIMATASSHGFDAGVPINHGGDQVVVELVNKEVHTATPIEIAPGYVTTALKKHFGDGVEVSGTTKGGACSQFTVQSKAKISPYLLMDLLATASVIDVWGFCDRLVVVVAHAPTHTSALTHLRQNKPELFSPQHCRTLADIRTRRVTAQQLRTRRAAGKKAAARASPLKVNV